MSDRLHPSPSGTLLRTFVVGLALAGALTMSACGVPADGTAIAVPTGEIPEGLQPDAPQPQQRISATELVDLWFVDGARLQKRRHPLQAPVGIQETMAELLLGPTEVEQRSGLRSAIPDPAVISDVAAVRGVAQVTLKSTFAEIPASDQVLAIGQIVLTLTDLRGIGRVRFLVGDNEVPVPLPTGEVSDGAVSRDDFVAMADSSG